MERDLCRLSLRESRLRMTTQTGAVGPGGRPRVKNSGCITCTPSSLCEALTSHAACSAGCQPLWSHVVRRVSNACLPADPRLRLGLIHLLNPPSSPQPPFMLLTGHTPGLAVEHLGLISPPGTGAHAVTNCTFTC